MKTCITYTVDIYIGSKIERNDHPDMSWSEYISFSSTTIVNYKRFLQEYCDEVGLCVSITDIEYTYTGGSESGIKVTLINYPRFPSNPLDINAKALYIARRLKKIGKQKRCSVITPKTTYMLENEDEDA